LSVLALAAAAALLAAMYVAMTQAGFSGNPRYAVPAVALWCVLAGVGLARLLEVRRGGVAVGVAGALALTVLAAPGVNACVERLRVEARGRPAHGPAPPPR
jgi:peptidoglycan/LPS O-acetylase OafA/YrhL